MNKAHRPSYNTNQTIRLTIYNTHTNTNVSLTTTAMMMMMTGEEEAGGGDSPIKKHTTRYPTNQLTKLKIKLKLNA